MRLIHFRVRRAPPAFLLSAIAVAALYGVAAVTLHARNAVSCFALSPMYCNAARRSLRSRSSRRCHRRP
jgi:hypothetical protein